MTELEMAKAEFLKYGCSKFKMARESEFYHEGSFTKLEIPETILYQWSREKLEDLSKEIAETGSVLPFVQLADIVEDYCSKENLLLVANTMSYVALKDSQTTAIFAETLLGRRIIEVRDGLIFKAYDLGERELAHSFLMKTKELLGKPLSDGWDGSRMDSDRKRCKEVEQLLF